MSLNRKKQIANQMYPVIPTLPYILMSMLYIFRAWVFWNFIPGKTIIMHIPDSNSSREMHEYISLLGREDLDYGYKVTAYDVSIKFRWGKTKHASYVALRWSQ
jgi:hypothetical protein